MYQHKHTRSINHKCVYVRYKLLLAQCTELVKLNSIREKFGTGSQFTTNVTNSLLPVLPTQEDKNLLLNFRI
jgi:hypothetical protein